MSMVSELSGRPKWMGPFVNCQVGLTVDERDRLREHALAVGMTSGAYLRFLLISHFEHEANHKHQLRD